MPNYEVSNSVIAKYTQKNYNYNPSSCHLSTARKVADYYRGLKTPKKKCSPQELIYLLEALNVHNELKKE